MSYLDASRIELYGSDPEVSREFTAQVWYPAVPGKNDRQAQWMSDIEYAAPAIPFFFISK